MVYYMILSFLCLQSSDPFSQTSPHMADSRDRSSESDSGDEVQGIIVLIFNVLELRKLYVYTNLTVKLLIFLLCVYFLNSSLFLKTFYLISSDDSENQTDKWFRPELHRKIQGCND